LKTAFKMCPF